MLREGGDEVTRLNQTILCCTLSPSAFKGHVAIVTQRDCPRRCRRFIFTCSALDFSLHTPATPPPPASNLSLAHLSCHKNVCTTDLFHPPLLHLPLVMHSRPLITHQLCLLPFVTVFLLQQVADGLDVVLQVAKKNKRRQINWGLFSAGERHRNT